MKILKYYQPMGKKIIEKKCIDCIAYSEYYHKCIPYKETIRAKYKDEQYCCDLIIREDMIFNDLINSGMNI